jgi:hypothetical protein
MLMCKFPVPKSKSLFKQIQLKFCSISHILGRESEAAIFQTEIFKLDSIFSLPLLFNLITD